MKDREFIKLLNLYVDREIGAEDALKLEREVATNQERRRVYDQYCRIQKACAMLTEEIEETVPSAEAEVAEFPAQPTWRIRPVFAGMAAVAACGVALLGMSRWIGAPLAPAHSAPVAAVADVPTPSETMKPVFQAHLPSSQAPGVRVALFASSDSPSQIEDLNWIGDIHMTPVFPDASSQILLSAKSGLKGSVLTEAQAPRDTDEPSEMAAFRFER